MADWYERQKISRKEKYEELKKMAFAYGAGKKKQFRVLQAVKRAERKHERKSVQKRSRTELPIHSRAYARKSQNTMRNTEQITAMVIIAH